MIFSGSKKFLENTEASNRFHSLIGDLHIWLCTAHISAVKDGFVFPQACSHVSAIKNYLIQYNNSK